MKRIRRFIRRYEPYFLPFGWAIEYEWYHDQIPGEDEYTHACNSTSWSYLQATIRFATQKTAALSDERLEEAVIHEFVHLATKELCDPRGDKERPVVALARIIQAIGGK